MALPKCRPCGPMILMPRLPRARTGPRGPRRRSAGIAHASRWRCSRRRMGPGTHRSAQLRLQPAARTRRNTHRFCSPALLPQLVVRLQPGELLASRRCGRRCLAARRVCCTRDPSRRGAQAARLSSSRSARGTGSGAQRVREAAPRLRLVDHGRERARGCWRVLEELEFLESLSRLEKESTSPCCSRSRACQRSDRGRRALSAAGRAGLRRPVLAGRRRAAPGRHPRQGGIHAQAGNKSQLHAFAPCSRCWPRAV